MIRSVANNNMHWDVINGEFNNYVRLQVYPANYSAAQKFIIKKEYMYQGEQTYRIIPLYANTKVIKLWSENDGEELQIDDEKYSEFDLFSDKYIFTNLGNNRFIIKTGASNFTKCITAGNINISTNEKLNQRQPSASISNNFLWEIIKTDYIGINVYNLCSINGLNNSRFLFRPQYTSKYVIETKNKDISLDTYITLNSCLTGNVISYNDNSGEDNNAKIICKLNANEDYEILVKGNLSTIIGECYLVCHPKNNIYLSGNFDYGYENIDRVSSLNESKTYIESMGYYPNVCANLGYNILLREDCDGIIPFDYDYYVHYGLGYSNACGVSYINGISNNQFLWNQLPIFKNKKLIIWLTSNSAKEHSINGSSVTTSIAYQSMLNGAEYSLGYANSLYNESCDAFIKNLFYFLINNDVEEAIRLATEKTISDNWWYWTFFGNYYDDLRYPIVYTQNNSENNSNYNVKINNVNYNFQEYRKEIFISNNINKLNMSSTIRSAINVIFDTNKESSKKFQFYHSFFNNQNYYIVLIANELNSSILFYDLLRNKYYSLEEFELIMNKYES